LALRLDAPDAAGPWKMVVTNDGDVPLRVAADGRLLSFEVEPSDDNDADAPYGKPVVKKKPTRPVVCKLPAELRPSAVAEDRAVILAPGSRYEEVVSPALYCFSDSEAKALAAGARVTAKLGFSEATKPNPKTPLKPPFIAEPAMTSPTVAAVKEIVSDRFVVAPAPPSSESFDRDTHDDPTGPHLTLTASPRIDSVDEKTVATTMTLKNTGRREARLHIRRDNFLFDIDGPDGSRHCGLPSSQRAVPREMMDTVAPGASRSIDVWIGELCSNTVFDRPGLYRVRAGLAFPPSGPDGQGTWTRTVITERTTLVRIRKGRLPFFTSPPQVFGPSGSGGSG
jgi:hypothetical protein